MRNLKRALSLALAAVMVIGMMVVGAGAVSYNDFTDKDEIVNEDAVSMVTELGIINGLPGGTFGPTQNIDRASFVKMVALAFNGGKEPMLPGDNKISYVDTAGTWASSYIEYCTNLGFVAGDGTTGKFNPTSPVTVSQAAKMLLVALGYNADVEGYVGYNWQMNVDAAANDSLYVGLSGSTSANLTRDFAAQMIYNALSATMVKYEGVYDLTTGTMKPQRTSDGMKTMLETKFGAVKVEGVVLANDYAGLNRSTTDEGRTYVDVKYADGETVAVAAGIFKVASTPDMLGKTVTMFVKPATNSTAASRATVLGALIVTNGNKVVELTAKKDTNAKIDSFLDDENLKMNGNTEYYVNYKLRDNGLTGDAYRLTEISKNVKGMVTTFIDNDDDGVVDYALQVIKIFGQVDSYNTTGDGTIYVSAVNPHTDVTDVIVADEQYIRSTDAAEDVKGFEDVELDDYVFFHYVAGTPYVEVAEYVDVTVSAVRGSDVTADGTTYSQSGLVSGFGDAGTDALNRMVELGEETRFYLDAAKSVVYTDSVDSTTNYVMVTNSDVVNSFRNRVEVEAVFADGTTAIINVNSDRSDAGIFETVTGGKAVKDGIYTYSVNSSDVYTLKDAGSRALTNDIERGKARLATNALANSSTVFVVQRGDSGNYSVYTGINNVPDLDEVSAAMVVKSSGIVDIVFVTDSSLSGNPEGIYVLDADPYISGTRDNPVYTYDVIYKGEKTTLTYDEELSPFWNNEGYYSNVVVSGGEIAQVNSTVTVDGEAVEAFVQKSEATRASGGLVGNGQGTFTYTDDTVVLLADGTDVSPASIRSIVVGTERIDGSNIVIVPDTDNANVAACVIICE